jgi:alpha-mannosidase
MLRADFAPSIYSDKVTCDIQFGSYDRSTKDDSSIRKAQFEICAHKWVDLSQKDYGISLINDCKYGHRVKEGIISLNLLRSPIYPDPTADRGQHHFRYAVYPHKGDMTKGNTIKESYHFNMTPTITNHVISFDRVIVADQKNIVIETIKKAEIQEGIILRLYESFGQQTSVELRVAFGYKEAFECDMLENALSKTDLHNLNFTPFEVKTILLTLKAETRDL